MIPNKCKCNWYPYIARITDYLRGDILGYYVTCENCGQSSRMASTAEEAVIAWNEEEENK